MDQSAYAAVPVAGTFQPQQTQNNVLCCLCGVAIPPNPTNMCINCIRTQVDITEGIQKQVSILWCKGCSRYLQPPKHWVKADHESKELLTFCIKRVKGLSKVKLVDASFIWTEPHSMRLKTKLTVQGEVLNGAILQQSFIVEFVVERQMCTVCNRQNANPNSWVSCVQVRQHVAHKRTFFFLEQLILKHGADENCVNIKDIHEGIDFYFGNRAHAVKFVDFLQAVVPIRYRHDKQLVSHDTHTSSYNYKYTFSVEIAPVCKDDLLCLPPKVASSNGAIGPLVICTRATSAITVTDPRTLRSISLDTNAYWRYPFKAMMSAKQLVEYIVLDSDIVESNGFHNGKHALADVVVAKVSDFGVNDKTYIARTHLGHLLHAGDHALGYDLGNANVVDPDLEKAMNKGFELPDVVLVRKSYEERRQRRRAKGHQRYWKLKRMQVESAMDEVNPSHKQRGNALEQERLDMERFMEELEEDADMRSRVALYKDGNAVPAVVETDDEDGDFPEIPLEDLLDDLAAMQLEEGGDDDAGDEMMDDA